MDVVGRWSLLVLFILLSFLFCAILECLRHSNEVRLQKMAGADERLSARVDRILRTSLEDQARRMNLCYLMVQTIAIYVGLSLLLPRMLGLLRPALVDHIAHPFLYGTVGAMLWLASFLLLFTVLLSVCHVLPKRLFRAAPERLLLSIYPAAMVFSLPFRPVACLIDVLGEALASLFGYDRRRSFEHVTEEEIRELVDASEESGSIEEEERDMIHNIFDFDDMDVSEIMTHRTDIIGLDIHAKISDAVYHAINDGFSRIPLYENDLDNIKGVLYVKDLLCLVGCNSSEEFKLTDFIRKAIFIPEARKCTDLLQDFKSEKAHMAIVVDDYGGTSGIVSMEDLLEAIVGNIQDEYDNEQEKIIELEDGSFLMDGSTDLEEVTQRLSMTFEEDDEVSTLGGLITNTLGRIPGDGETPSITIGNLLFSVVLAKDNRVERVKVKILPGESPDKRS